MFVYLFIFFVDIDECKKESKQKCLFGKCQNTFGSYECTCDEGFKQSKNKRKCRGMNSNC